MPILLPLAAANRFRLERTPFSLSISS
ncbi:hypothetical protein F383_22639 [Gossypium arboreum]|uniref:Uncharacterized protein n=1 Tax=Gossypium arboreum TaxID=29729 RepID=A0A0B0NM76_GOSAR|nr:hypothetical protein F383_22639 [Gossypium arboreum]